MAVLAAVLAAMLAIALIGAGVDMPWWGWAVLGAACAMVVPGPERRKP